MPERSHFLFPAMLFCESPRLTLLGSVSCTRDTRRECVCEQVSQQSFIINSCTRVCTFQITSRSCSLVLARLPSLSRRQKPKRYFLDCSAVLDAIIRAINTCARVRCKYHAVVAARASLRLPSLPCLIRLSCFACS